MNRTRRKAIKMHKRRLGRATVPYWHTLRHPIMMTEPELLAMFQRAMDAVDEACRLSALTPDQGEP